VQNLTVNLDFAAHADNRTSLPFTATRGRTMYGRYVKHAEVLRRISCRFEEMSATDLDNAELLEECAYYLTRMAQALTDDTGRPAANPVWMN